MKKLLTCLLSICIVGACLTGCAEQGNGGNGGNGGNEPGTATDLITDAESIKYGFSELYRNSELTDEENNFSATSDITGARFLVNGEYKTSFTEMTSRQDVQMEFYNGDYARVVNVSGGMAYTVPTTDKLEIDYSIAKYRTQITLGESILTVSAESGNPYGTTSDPWGIYRKEWLLRFLHEDNSDSDVHYAANQYAQKNDLTITEHKFNDTAARSGYDMYLYSVTINDNENIERPYYNIGIIREAKENIRFGMFVMKGKEDRKDDMLSILMSYELIGNRGIAKNYYNAGTPEEDPNWSDETKAYYAQLQDTNNVDWGVFSYSMPGGYNELEPGQPGYDRQLANSIAMRDGIEEAWGHDFGIYPTYTHISWGGNMHYFPVAMANELAGGNGVNGKPVLQFTYQFTTDNNIVANNSTPMFDILRGEYDNHFKKLAQDIKSYGKPVLFRLNNEMNTDWTSYCGLITLCDPDIFNLTWQYLYKVFEEEGVDNCIWIWNPIRESCPYSSWGEDLCYNPGADYVHLVGLTSYEMNNGSANDLKSFRNMYKALYDKNGYAWSEYRSIISEFGCGSGGDYSGELGRNAALQAQWVTDMFTELNNPDKEGYIKQIVGAVWFNCNDYAGDGRITNRLRFFDPSSNDYADLADTVAAFRKGFAKE